MDMNSKFKGMEGSIENYAKLLDTKIVKTTKLECKINDLTEQVRQLTEDVSVVEAKKIFAAAEIRFITVLCSKETDCKYSRLYDIIEDIHDNSASEEIKNMWKKYRNVWNHKLLSRLIRDLSETRGHIANKGRNQEKYANMKEDEVRAVFESAAVVIEARGLKISTEQIDAVIQLHCATVKQYEI